MDLNNDWKAKLGAAFGIDPEQVAAEAETPQDAPKSINEQQGKTMIDILLDKKNRNGKKATLLTGFVCDDEALKSLAKALKQHCGVGGSARGGEILIQGDFREKAMQYLKSQGFKARII